MPITEPRPMPVEELVEQLRTVPPYFSVYFSSEEPITHEDVRTRNGGGLIAGPHLSFETPDTYIGDALDALECLLDDFDEPENKAFALEVLAKTGRR